MLNRHDTLTQIKDAYQTDYNRDYNYLMSKFPPDEIWRFFVDGTRQNNVRIFYLKCLTEIIKELNANLTKDNQIVLTDCIVAATKKYCADVTTDPVAANTNLWNQLTDYIQFHIEFNGIPENIAERLSFEELAMHAAGWLPFERIEPGYIKAMTEALSQLVNMQSGVTVDLIQKIHKNTTNKVKNLNNGTIPGELRKILGMRFSVDVIDVDDGQGHNGTVQGIAEYLDKIENNPYRDTHTFVISFTYLTEPNTSESFELCTDVFANLKKRIFTLCHKDQKFDSQYKNINFAADIIALSKGSVKFASLLLVDEELSAAASADWCQKYLFARMNDYIVEYRNSIARAKTDLEKIKAIVVLIRDLEQLHPFYDANCRSMCMLLTNHLLKLNHFPPAIFENPNYFDGYSVEQLIDEVIKGMKNSLAVANGEKALYGIETKVLNAVASTEEKAMFAATVANWIADRRAFASGKRPPISLFEEQSRGEENEDILDAVHGPVAKNSSSLKNS